MRIFSLVLLLALAGAVVAFALQNTELVSVRFFDWGITAKLAVLVGVVYLLGMLSGWSIIGMLRRSMHRVTERRG